MKKFKRILSIALIAILAVSCFAGCSKGGTEAGEGGANGGGGETSSLFISITNAKNEVKFETNTGANQTVKKDTINTAKNTPPVIVKNVAAVDVADRWTATYNCNNISMGSELTVTPNQGDNNLFGMSIHFDAIKFNIRSTSFTSATFVPTGKLTLKGVNNFNVSADGMNSKIMDLSVSGNATKDVKIEKTSDTTIVVSSDANITNFTVTYMKGFTGTSTDETKEEDRGIKFLNIEGDKNTYTITIAEDGSVTLD